MAIYIDRIRQPERAIPGRERDRGRSNSRQIAALKQTLRCALDEILTPRQQNCIKLYYIEGRNMAEIGKELGIDESTVSRHIKAAKRKLGQLRSLL